MSQRVPKCERLILPKEWRAKPSPLSFDAWRLAVQSILIDDLLMDIGCAMASTDLVLNSQPLHMLYREGYSALLCARVFFDNWLEIVIEHSRVPDPPPAP